VIESSSSQWGTPSVISRCDLCGRVLVFTMAFEGNGEEDTSMMTVTSERAREATIRLLAGERSGQEVNHGRDEGVQGAR
jgi:hypothetical protein